ncbi:MULTISPECIES: ABC transporter permease [unclassified Rathayibacter]|uniref:ABC transporter permease n=1 Tax=unclassified Rathayibacter TaxID=2609250 RepID=UPI000CE8B374|nr:MULTISPECIES: ABC transporter permease [unclassified Rathayibacter]PPH29912.1 ABC transporter permease [Rathayibacter sp. AY1C3]PPH57199.1 ABC transporter permease [Rathayibacter sp. AY1D7]PPI28865.1 ABC transporter permease [Rathayibacter sp. AY1B4]
MSGVRTGSSQGGGAIVIVAALAAAFGAVLVQVIADMVAAFAAAGIDGIGQVALMLGMVGAVFFGIAVFVGGIVTANAVSTVIAGRTREIALLRLLGASGRSLRSGIVRTGLLQGLLGAAIGLVAGVALVALAAELAIRSGTLPRFDYPLVSPGLVLPLIAVVASTVIASWSGSRRVLAVAPSQAAGSSAEPRYEELRGRTARNVTAIVFVVVGALLLAAGVVLGLANPGGVLLGLVGGMASFTGVILGAPVLLPPLTALVGRAFGRGPVARLASANAVRNPARSARAVIGLVIGVSLVTMFAAAAATFGTIMERSGETNPEVIAAFEQFIQVSTAVMSVLLGFSVVLAAVGMVNTLSLSVLQRRRELGLLRALGFTGSQVRSMVVLEAAQMIIAAAVLGIVLGIVYGWCGAISVFGSLPGIGLIPPTVPVPILVAVLVVGVVITVVSAVLPARRATKVSPVAALAVA